MASTTSGLLLPTLKADIDVHLISCWSVTGIQLIDVPEVLDTLKLVVFHTPPLHPAAYATPPKVLGTSLMCDMAPLTVALGMFSDDTESNC